MIKKILKFFDRLEDRTRAKLSRSPILYAFLGGIGIVLFWRGVWHLADDLSLNSTMSIIIGSVVLLITGIFVSVFVGNRIILSGLIGEKKLAEKTESEIETEEAQIKKLQESLKKVEEKLEHIDRDIEGR